MKILHIIVGLDTGGAELMLERLICHSSFELSTPKVEHEVISLTNLGVVGNRLRSRGVKVTCLGWGKNLKPLFGFFLLRRAIKKTRPNIIHTWMYHADFFGTLAAKSLGIDNIVWCVRSTNIETGSRVTLLIRKLNALLSRFAPSKIIYAAEKSRIVHEAKGYNKKIGEVIPNGYDLERYKPSSLSRKRLRKYLNIEEDSVVLVSVGRFHPVKNHELLIKAFNKLFEEYGDELRDVVCILAGRGLDSRNKELRGMLHRVPIDTFRLLGEYSDSEVLYAASDIFCLHSVSEGFPNVLAEAMATAIPCVTTDVGDAAYLLGDSRYLVESNDVDALADRLAKLIFLDERERKRLGMVNRARVEAMFSIESTVRRYTTVYEDVLQRNV